MIKIVMSNSDVVKWEAKEYTDYKYDGKYFIIIRNGEYVGLYNLNYIVSVIVKPNEENNN